MFVTKLKQMSIYTFLSIFFGFPIVMVGIFFWLRSARKRNNESLEHGNVVPAIGDSRLGTAFQASTPSIVREDSQNFRMIGNFSSLDSFGPDNLQSMVDILSQAGIESYWKTSGGGMVPLAAGGIPITFELWAADDKAEDAAEVLRQKYFKS